MKKLPKYSAVQLIAVAILTGIIGFTIVTKFSAERSAVVSNMCHGICVNLTKDGINPDTLAVKIGEYVQFNSADGQEHDIGFGSGTNDARHETEHEHIGQLESGNFKADEGWRVQFNTVGTYEFHDHYNPKQNILIVVYKPKDTPN